MPRLLGTGATTRTLVTLCRVTIVGSALGVLSSLMVNAALVEVSCSPFFAVSFGLLFLTSAGTVGYQLHQEANAKNGVVLTAFALLNAGAGSVCFLLERDWSHGLTATRKVPLYALLGMCLAFSVNFSALNLLARFGMSVSGMHLVRAEWQVRVVATTSVVTGAMYGLTFGLLDIEDQLVRSALLFWQALHREARVCYPVGAASGAFTALLARLLEIRAEALDPDLGYARGHGGRRHDTL